MTRQEKLLEADSLEERAHQLRREAFEEHQQELTIQPLADRLIYAAYNRCPCGAGLAYDPAEKEDGVFLYGNGHWDCSAILLGNAIPKDQPGSVQHTGRFPFTFYSIKSEGQPSAHGATTRPTVT